MDVTISRLQSGDLRAYTQHCIRCLRENGLGGRPSHPFPLSHPWNEDELYQKYEQRVTAVPFTPTWQITWVASVGGDIIGDILLRTGLVSQLHRMHLGISIETEYRSRGIGKKLMSAMLSWAMEQKELAWIDLYVFAHNEAAIRLYERFGFRQTYTVEDAFRLDGESIDDIQMVLKLR